MIDTEIKLTGRAANEFRHMMRTKDSAAIAARDRFLSGMENHVDALGIMSIELPDLNIDLRVLEEDSNTEIEVALIPKKDHYVQSVSVGFSTNNIGCHIQHNSFKEYYRESWAVKFMPAQSNTAHYKVSESSNSMPTATNIKLAA